MKRQTSLKALLVMLAVLGIVPCSEARIAFTKEQCDKLYGKPTQEEPHYSPAAKVIRYEKNGVKIAVSIYNGESVVDEMEYGFAAPLSGETMKVLLDLNVKGATWRTGDNRSEEDEVLARVFLTEKDEQLSRGLFGDIVAGWMGHTTEGAIAEYIPRPPVDYIVRITSSRPYQLKEEKRAEIWLRELEEKDRARVQVESLREESERLASEPVDSGHVSPPPEQSVAYKKVGRDMGSRSSKAENLVDEFVQWFYKQSYNEAQNNKLATGLRYLDVEALLIRANLRAVQRNEKTRSRELGLKVISTQICNPSEIAASVDFTTSSVVRLSTNEYKVTLTAVVVAKVQSISVPPEKRQALQAVFNNPKLVRELRDQYPQLPAEAFKDLDSFLSVISRMTGGAGKAVKKLVEHEFLVRDNSKGPLIIDWKRLTVDGVSVFDK